MLSSDHGPGLGRATGTIATAVVLLLAGASAALADSAAISVTTTTGASDPVAGVPRIVAVSGVASVPERVYVKYRAAGGAPCASSSSSDSGTVLGGFYAENVVGAFSLQDVIDWNAPGDVLFCTWLSTADAETVMTPIAQVITFRSPSGSIGATVTPTKPPREKQVAIEVTGSSEAPAAVYARVRPAGRSLCAPTYAADAGQSLIDDASVNGAFSLRLTTTQAKAGRYLVCLWLARSASDASPIAGPQPVIFDVTAPPTPCVVPSVGVNRRPAAVRQRIRAAHCSVGRTLHGFSRTLRKGAVIRLGRRPHSRLATGAPIGLVISSGPPRQRGRPEAPTPKRAREDSNL